MNNKIGKRGESIFSTIVGRDVPSKGYLLDPVFLGDKFPTVDFYVDLLKYPKKRGFFFASVKTTTLGVNKKNKLKISVPKEEIALLSKFTVPVYLFGINEKTEEGYFISCNSLDPSKNLNGVPLLYPVNSSNVGKLWKEVCNYWNTNKEITNFVSSFK